MSQKTVLSRQRTSQPSPSSVWDESIYKRLLEQERWAKHQPLDTLIFENGRYD